MDRTYVSVLFALVCLCEVVFLSPITLAQAATGEKATPKAESTREPTLNRTRDLARLMDSRDYARGLALEYNVLLAEGGDVPPRSVDPTKPFKTGDCIALELKANGPGYLFILAEQASHKWLSLFPSVIDPEGMNAVSAGAITRAPAKGCFQFVDPVGTERLFLLLLQAQTDVEELVRAYKLSSAATPPEEGVDPVEKVQKQLTGRDIKFRSLENTNVGGQAFTTYAIAPDPRLSIELRLKHQ
jgi:hypothetical protein